jgi:hypothetical protein
MKISNDIEKVIEKVNEIFNEVEKIEIKTKENNINDNINDYFYFKGTAKRKINININFNIQNIEIEIEIKLKFSNIIELAKKIKNLKYYLNLTDNINITKEDILEVIKLFTFYIKDYYYLDNKITIPVFFMEGRFLYKIIPFENNRYKNEYKILFRLKELDIIKIYSNKKTIYFLVLEVNEDNIHVVNITPYIKFFLD